MLSAETVQAKALRMLKVIYERTKSGQGGIDREEVRGLLGLSTEDANAGWTYLTDKQLVTPFNIPSRARINAQGVEAIEAAQLDPDKTTSIFPSVTYNTINVHQMVSSTIQQGGAGATMTTTYSGEQVESRLSDCDEPLDLDGQNRKSDPAHAVDVDRRHEDLPKAANAEVARPLDGTKAVD